MSTARKQPLQDRAADEPLQARYKPLGLPAVVAATRCKPEAKTEVKRPKRDIPAVLQPLYD
ncbi:hypothetical protein AB3G45_18810 [Shinella sp. S4-D37]|uniref:hypothetical protein n=1 Tax=Shinella sp. S4-D37 TaxID=3161999 RepID=UPI003467007D